MKVESSQTDNVYFKYIQRSFLKKKKNIEIDPVLSSYVSWLNTNKAWITTYTCNF